MIFRGRPIDSHIKRKGSARAFYFDMAWHIYSIMKTNVFWWFFDVDLSIAISNERALQELSFDMAIHTSISKNNENTLFSETDISIANISIKSSRWALSFHTAHVKDNLVYLILILKIISIRWTSYRGGIGIYSSALEKRRLNLLVAWMHKMSIECKHRELNICFYGLKQDE